MFLRIIHHAGVDISVRCPASASRRLLPLLDSLPSSAAAEPDGHIEIIEQGNGSYRIRSGARDHAVSVVEKELAGCLLIMLTGELAHRQHDGLALHAAAVALDGRGILLPGTRGAGKTSLTAWLAAHGCEHLTDELACIAPSDGRLDCFRQPLNVRAEDYPRMAGLLDEIGATILPGRDLMLAVLPASSATGPVLPSLILFTQFRRSAPRLCLEVLPPARAAMRLMPCLLNASHLAGGGFREIATLARTVPALRLAYGATAQLASLPRHLLALLTSGRYTPGELQPLFAPFQTVPEPLPTPAPVPPTTAVPATTAARPIPEATPPGPKKRLTIGMATYDDFDGVWFTAHAIRMYHPEVTADTEILVIDNNPGGPCGTSLKLEHEIEGYRYVPLPDHCGTAVRDYLFRHAAGDVVLVLDCHVLLEPGVLARLLAYLDTHPDSPDLLQGPMFGSPGTKLNTHFYPVWQKGMYGVWGQDERGQNVDGEPFDIPMQGLGLFCCRKAAWPGFNPRFRGFGGEEGYIHEKIRQRGGRTLCLPFLRWQHRFARPMGVPYNNKWEDRLFNYMVGSNELGLDTTPIREHFIELLGQETGNRLCREVEEEIHSPFFFFDAIYCITLDPDGERCGAMRRRFKALGIADRVRIFRAIATPDNHHVGCALSHRAVIAQASNLQLDNVLVFEDDALFHQETLSLLAESVTELRRHDWRLFYLGGHRWNMAHPMADGCRALRRTSHPRPTCTHALAYHASVFPRLLTELPETAEGMTDWIARFKGIDQYLRMVEHLYLAEPVVATQVELLPQEAPEHRSRFTLGEG